MNPKTGDVKKLNQNICNYVACSNFKVIERDNMLYCIEQRPNKCNYIACSKYKISLSCSTRYESVYPYSPKQNHLIKSYSSKIKMNTERISQSIESPPIHCNHYINKYRKLNTPVWSKPRVTAKAPKLQDLFQIQTYNKFLPLQYMANDEVSLLRYSQCGQ